MEITPGDLVQIGSDQSRHAFQAVSGVVIEVGPDKIKVDVPLDFLDCPVLDSSVIGNLCFDEAGLTLVAEIYRPYCHRIGRARYWPDGRRVD